MKKSLVVLIALFSMVSCIHSEAEGISIQIVKMNEHPTLPDHDRLLVAKINGKEIDKVMIDPDPGVGVPLHFIKNGNKITAIDCNGMWYEITKNGIKKLGWKWYEPLPNGVVMRIAQNEKHEYITTKLGSVELSDVYVFKDPQD